MPQKYSLLKINFLYIIANSFCDVCEVRWILAFDILEAKMELGRMDGFWEMY